MTTHTTDHQPRTRLVLLGAFVLAAAVLAVVVLVVTPGSDAQGTSIVINEIQAGNVATLADGDGDFEDWIELRNTTNADIDIAGWRIDDSTGSWTVTFDPLRPERTIVPANGFLLVWASDKGLVGEPGFPGPAGELHASFKLSRTTDSVTLTNGFTVVDMLSYGPAEVPTGFDDDESYGFNDAGALVVFTPVDVTPLAPNGQVTVPTPISVGPPSIVINEVMQGNQITIADGDGEYEDWFELYNPTCESVDLTGWTVRDSAEEWQLPDAAVLAPGDVLFLWASNKGDPTNVDQFPGPAGELHTNFRLALAGEDLLLLNDAGQQIALVNPGPSAVDESYGLTAAGDYVTLVGATISPDALNPGQTAPVCIPTPTPTPTPTPLPTPTPGGPTATPTALPTAPPTLEECAARSAVPSIVINEAQSQNTFTIVDGDGDFEDWIELYNPTDETIDVTGWRIRDTLGSWRVPSGFNTESVPSVWVPRQVTIAPGEYLLIWASGKDGLRRELRSPFRLSEVNGDFLSLEDRDGCVRDELTLPPLGADESFGLTTDGTPGTFDRRYATPRGANGSQGPTPQECASRVVTQGIVINEAQSRNSLTITDGDGDFGDWIELFNPTDATVDLSGWVVKDTTNEWQFPFGIDPATGAWIPDQVTIASGEYLLIWTSGKGLREDPDYPGPEGEFHTQFRLSGPEGESLSLEDFDGCVMDELTLPPLGSNESFGRTNDGTDGVFDLYFPTPLAPNEAQSWPVRSTCYAPASDVRINRIVARNDGLLLDANGDDSDFIELLNTGLNDIDISLWQLRDESDWSVIPDGTVVRAGKTLILWASGKGDVLDSDYPGPAGEIHLTFRLAGDGEQLTFAEPSECIVEQFTYPELRTNHAYGYDARGQRTIIVPVASAPACAAPGSIQIGAISAKNDADRPDEDGDFGDWFELRNTTDQAIDLSGWILADDSNTWTVPDGVTAAPMIDLLVWSDEKDRGGPDAPLHTSFKLSAGGETVSVSSAVGCVIDVVTYPEVDDDQIYRRSADGSFALEGDGPADENDKDDEPAEGDISISGSCIAINEVMAKNDSTLEDEDGEFGDWIELVNLSAETIDLSGYAIADFSDSWTFPDGVEIEASGFLIVWADEQDRGEAGEELHTNFKLGSGGELITVTDTAGEIVARMSSYPELDDDESFGVGDNGDYVFFDAGDATPGEGPTREACDFEVSSANAAAATGDDNAADGDAGDADAELAADAGDADAVGDSEDNLVAETALATTGTSTRVQSLLAQLLVLTGVTLVTMARIAHRRS